MNNENRLYKWDNIKAALIFVVVFGHLRLFFPEPSTIASYGYFWENIFNMPAFIFVAGLFSKHTIDNRRYYKVIPYLFLYLIMKALIFFSTILAQGGTENVSFSFFREDAIPWFALAMFWWHLVVIAISKVKPTHVILLSLFVSVLFGYTNDVGSFLALNRTIVFFPFFYFGYLCDNNRITDYLGQLWVRIISWLTVVSSLVITFMLDEQMLHWSALFKGNTCYSEMGSTMDVMWGGLWRIIAYTISTVLTIAIFAVIPSIRVLIISAVGRRTLAIFVFHIPLLILLLSEKTVVREWLVNGHIAWHCLLITIAVLLFLSIPIFDRTLRKLMSGMGMSKEND